MVRGDRGAQDGSLRLVPDKTLGRAAMSEKRHGDWPLVIATQELYAAVSGPLVTGLCECPEDATCCKCYGDSHAEPEILEVFCPTCGAAPDDECIDRATGELRDMPHLE